MRTINIGIIGLGTVGSGVIQIIQKHHDDFLNHQGVDIQITRVASRRDNVAREYGLMDVFSFDGMDVVNDPAIDIVVELVGGTGIAKDIILAALRAGKQVVTANKALMASMGAEVYEAAREGQTAIFYEAAVGGGIPIIGPLKNYLDANEISSIMGIVNGTTNYMLTRMSQNHLSYEDALAQAQKKGYAEADPTADVEGYDAAAKIAILASIAYNSRVTLDDVPTEGISALSATDIAYADEMGYCIKLLAIANRSEEGIDIRVHPTMLPKSHPLCAVNGVFNAIYVVGDFVGETMFYGQGAGSGPAASAVVGNIIEVARQLAADMPILEHCTCTDEVSLRPMDRLRTRYYLRFPVYDRPGVFAQIAEAFAAHNVSLYSVVQRGTVSSDVDEQENTTDVVVVTHHALEADMQAALAEIAQTETTAGVPALIRVV